MGARLATDSPETTEPRPRDERRPKMKNVVLIMSLAVMMGCATSGPVGEDETAPETTALETDAAQDLEADDEPLELPPEGAKPLSEIVASMEVPGHLQIIEVEFEDGAWEIEYVMDGEEHELIIDPMTGEAVPETEEDDAAEDLEADDEPLEVPPEGAKPLSEIVASMEVPGHLQIIEVEFEDGVWEIEYVMDGEEHELQIDPMTGESVPETEEDEASEEG
jgi:uncharacterized membrane protein YkoI